MKAKSWLILALIALIGLAVTTACQHARSDAQIGADVQNKITSDPSVQSRQFTVQSSNGIVTLSGAVTSDTERLAAASDAAQVQGVRTVVNNLQVAPPVVASEPPAPTPEPSAPEPKRGPAPERSAHREKPSGFRPAQSPKSGVNDYSSAPAPTTAASAQPVMPPPPPPKPVVVTIPEGTALAIRLIDPLDSEQNQSGDHFRASLDNAVVINDKVVIPAGADVYGRVTNAKSAAHFSGRSQLALELTGLSVNGKSYEVHTDQYSKQGTARGKNTAEKVGGGAALGAIIGGIAGGGKGAAIGGAIGAGAGTGVQAATHGEQIKLTSETPLTFHLEQALSVTPSSRSYPGRQRLDTSDDRNSGRQRIDTSNQ